MVYFPFVIATAYAGIKELYGVDSITETACDVEMIGFFNYGFVVSLLKELRMAMSASVLAVMTDRRRRHITRDRRIQN